MRKNPPTLDQLLASRQTRGVAASPDGRWIAFTTNLSGRLQLWKVPVEGGWPHQLTSFADRTVREFEWAHDGRDLVFNSDLLDDEKYQLYRIAAEGGVPERLTNRDDVQYHLARGARSPDGRFLAYSANEEKPADQDTYVRDLKTGETRRIDLAPSFHVAGWWAPDGRAFIVFALRRNTDNDLFLVPRGGAPRHLTPHTGDATHALVAWSPDARSLWVLTDRSGEFTSLARLDLRSGEWTPEVAPGWDVENAALSRDGRTLAYVVNEAGVSVPYVARGGRARRVRGLPLGVVLSMSLSANGRTLALLVSEPRRGAEIYVAGPDGAARRITDNSIGGVDERDLAVPKLVAFPTFDGRKIPAWLYRARGASAARPVACVLSLHGGPEYQERPSYLYNGIYQYWATHGVAVLAPNIRGSTGYGKSYQKLIHRDFGGNDLKDVEAAVAYLRGVPWIDAGRLAVFGGSYGGFLTLTAATRLPDVWRCAAEYCGPANLVTFARAVPPTWRRFMKGFVGDPDEDAEMLRARSPLTYVENLRAPILILQGARDPRVVKSESDQMVERLRTLGREVEYHVFEDEGHGFTRRENLHTSLRLVAAFFERHLGAVSAAAQAPAGARTGPPPAVPSAQTTPR